MERALAARPDNPQALWLAGWADFQSRDFARAAERWQLLRETAPGELADQFEGLSERIAEAQRLAGQPVSVDDNTGNKMADSAEADAVSPASITVAVKLAPALKEPLNKSLL